MKKLLLFTGFYLLIFNLNTWAHKDASSTSNTPQLDMYQQNQFSFLQPEGAGLFLGRNIVKVNLASLALLNYSFQYEFLISKRISVALGLRFMPSKGVPYKNQIMNLISDSSMGEVKSFINQAQFGSFALTPEFRYYFREAGNGAYIAPFVRYDHFSVKSQVPLDINGNTYDIAFNGRLTRYGFGIMFGTQFKLPANFYIDWWIAGPYISMSDYYLNASGFTISDADYNDYVSKLNEFDLSQAGMKTEIIATKTSATLKAKGIMPGARAFGLCLGYKF